MSGLVAPASPPPSPPVLAVPAGGRVVVASDLHLGAVPSTASGAAAAELARRLDAVTGPAALVLAGDVFELWSEPNNSPAKALRAHPRLVEAIRAFAAAPDRQVALVVGNRDDELGWCPSRRAEATGALDPGPGAGAGITVVAAVDLDIATGQGPALVRVEHGHQLEPFNASTDPARPGDRPLGLHGARELVPALALAGDDGWLDDVAGLTQPGLFAAYVASRLFYRRLARRLGWVLVPGAMAAAAWLLPYVLTPLGPAPARLGRRALDLRLPLGAAVLLYAIGVGLVLAGLAGGGVDAGRSDPNAAARRRAVTLAASGYRGLITGHTHQAELVDLGVARCDPQAAPGTRSATAGSGPRLFYANPGCGAMVVRPVPARAGLPPVFERVNQVSWLELGAGPELTVELWLGETPSPAPGRLERRAGRTRRPAPSRPVKVAALEPHRRWPPALTPDRSGRHRRLAAGAVAVVGLLDLASALTPPLRPRAGQLLRILPPLVPSTASLATAAAGAGLLTLAAGLRRGQRRAWVAALALLAVSALANVGKGLDVEEAAAALGVGVLLAGWRRSFQVAGDRVAGRRALAVLSALAGATVASALAVAAVGHVGVGALVTDFAQRALGLGRAPLTRRWRPVSAAVSGMGLATVAYAGWLALRPARPGPGPDPAAVERVWQLVRRHGRGTLDWFALRDDKTWFVTGETVVAYRVSCGVALVSPDPVGPPDERARAWAAFRRFAADRGWAVAVLGAGEEWLATYHESGMRSIYAGDEAVVDVTRFSLDGPRNKHLRQIVSRMDRAGFQVSVHRSGDLDAETADELRAVAGQSRRGDVERGYSMTLSRLLDPRDDELLVAVARDGAGAVQAFCQFVPAPGIGGWSLDLMRRAAGPLPNGVTDRVVIATILHLQATGERALGLNFAAMRAVLAGDTPDSWLSRRQRWVLRRLGDSMQIESLWRFNAKYDPIWVPRWLVVDSPEHLVTSALAVARAESLWELPLIGRFLRAAPDGPR
ncbi:MAG: phosphatidylglycerol lysyltransferase domain-containing protein [Acidimicrobiales bacterium]